MKEIYNELEYRDWRQSKQTLQLFAQILGKYKLALAPSRNHWWHVSLRPTVSGFSTGPLRVGAASFEFELDLIRHRLVYHSNIPSRKAFSIINISVSDFYGTIQRLLREDGITPPRIYAFAYDMGNLPSFAENKEKAAYDSSAVEQYFRIINAVTHVFEQFSGMFSGKASAPQLFWHSFDLAISRFSGEPVPPGYLGNADAITLEGYSHEVIAFGFWPGDEVMPEAAFYSYAHPLPDALVEQPLLPESAYWGKWKMSSMALLRWQDLIKEPEPEAALLSFLQSAYEAGAECLNWNVEQLRR